MRLTEAAESSFARHETFHPRYGWFRKAYSFVVNDPEIFIRKDAPVQLGVGKNMVRAIRFWGLAAKLIEPNPRSRNPRSPELVPTRLGRELFGDPGWDPYMEDPGTLWLLHWLLLAPRSRLPVWWLAFNEFHPLEFADGDLEAAAVAHLDAVAGWAAPHPSSIKKDVSALLRTYAPAERSARIGIDDLLDCPLRELNLLGRSAATSRYRFTMGAKPRLPSAILAYAALDYIDRTDAKGRSVTLSRLTHEPGAPGKAFKLTESEFQAALEPTIDETGGLGLTTATGDVQLSWSGEPREAATGILDRYYGRSSNSNVRAGEKHERPTDLASEGVR